MDKQRPSGELQAAQLCQYSLTVKKSPYVWRGFFKNFLMTCFIFLFQKIIPKGGSCIPGVIQGLEFLEAGAPMVDRAEGPST
ncbi:MAG: hypothetical protein K9M07_07665 [Simkaniaceae bacterium]|nr:hypothetical protein [Simkaniaceae bacterium]